MIIGHLLNQIRVLETELSALKFNNNQDSQIHDSQIHSVVDKPHDGVGFSETENVKESENLMCRDCDSVFHDAALNADSKAAKLDSSESLKCREKSAFISLFTPEGILENQTDKSSTQMNNIDCMDFFDFFGSTCISGACSVHKNLPAGLRCTEHMVAPSGGDKNSRELPDKLSCYSENISCFFEERLDFHGSECSDSNFQAHLRVLQVMI